MGVLPSCHTMDSERSDLSFKELKVLKKDDLIKIIMKSQNPDSSLRISSLASENSSPFSGSFVASNVASKPLVA